MKQEAEVAMILEEFVTDQIPSHVDSALRKLKALEFVN